MLFWVSGSPKLNIGTKKAIYMKMPMSPNPLRIERQKQNAVQTQAKYT